MKFFTCLFFVVAAFFSAQAQPIAPKPERKATLPKINAQLLLIWQADRTENIANTPANTLHNTRILPLIIKGDAAQIRSFAANQDVLCKWCVKDFCALSLPLSALTVFVEQPFIERIEYHEAEMQRLNFPDDSIHLVHNNITPAHEGWGDLPQGMRGAGVLVSVIDDGFDWRHPDFKRPDDNTTRVQFLWDQGLQSGWLDAQYGYGSVWNKQNIDAGQCYQQPNMHGIHVAGIAAGNARAAGKFIGVAPESDLLWVKIGENSGAFLSQFVDAVYWSAQKSQLLGQPCAINSSVGSYTGSHDGRDLYSQAIAAIISQQSGLALIQAAGNARATPFHLRANLASNQDTARVCYKYLPSQNSTHFVLYADTANFNNINFSLQNIEALTFRQLSNSQTFALQTDFYTPNNSASQFYLPFYSLANGGNVELYLTIGNYNGVYELRFQIFSPPSSNYWQLTTSGEGAFDCWSAAALIGTSDIVDSSPIAHSIAPDNLQTIVGYWNCSEEVISVASYQNQTYIINYALDSFYLGTAGFPQGGISPFSSLGPTRDGRQKPEITASGGQVMSAAPMSNLLGFRASLSPNLDQAGFHVSNRGTSMSAPLVAGAVALFLQCQPTANIAEIRRALHQSARLDTFVFTQAATVPNVHWGYGKLDVYQLLLQCLHRGCMDTLADNFDERANLDNGGCLYLPLSVENNSTNNSSQFLIFPNPIDKSQINDIQYIMPDKYVGGQLFIYSSTGQLLANMALEAAQARLNLGLAGENVLGQTSGQVFWVVVQKTGLPPLRQAVFFSW
jgi:subtilisin family serine protease